MKPRLAEVCLAPCRHLLVDGGLSGGSRVRRPGSEDPHRRERRFFAWVLTHKKIKYPRNMFNQTTPPFLAYMPLLLIF
jgi:hypothetical protein